MFEISANSAHHESVTNTFDENSGCMPAISLNDAVNTFSTNGVFVLILMKKAAFK
jgi:hypothetical protein